MRQIKSAKSRPIRIALLLTSGLLISLLLQAISFASDHNGAAPANSGYVYVGWFSGSTDYISGFAVAADGSAQTIPGSPFNLPSFGLVTARNYVFGEDGQNIATYALASNGALQETSVVDDLAHCAGCNGQVVYALNLDRAGQTLNTVISCGSCNSEVLPWSVGANGQLSYIGGPGLPGGPAKWQGVMTFTGDDRFVYTPIAQDFGILERNSNGSLTWIRPGPVNAPPLGDLQHQVCNINTVAASTRGYITLAWYGGGPGCNDSGYVLGNYTVAPNGALDLVPGSGVTPEVPENGMAFDPTGSYLAIAGGLGQYPQIGGIQIYKLQQNGTLAAVGTVAEPPGAPPFGYVLWDNAYHVYALTANCYQCGGPNAGLYVFNFDGQTLTLAPGSPHSIQYAISLAVVPGS